MSRLAAWVRANLVPLVLIPLAAVLIWVAVWRIWLPPAGSGGAVARSVTTVDANAPTRPTHKVTTVVRATRAAGPARRSEPLALALVFLGAGAAVVGVFHDRIGSLQLGKDGIKIDLTEAEGAGRRAARRAPRGARRAARDLRPRHRSGTWRRSRRGGACVRPRRPERSAPPTQSTSRTGSQTSSSRPGRTLHA